MIDWTKPQAYTALKSFAWEALSDRLRRDAMTPPAPLPNCRCVITPRKGHIDGMWINEAGSIPERFFAEFGGRRSGKTAKRKWILGAGSGINAPTESSWMGVDLSEGGSHVWQFIDGAWRKVG